MFRGILTTSILCLALVQGHAQDTLHVGLRSADSLLTVRSLQLVAQRYAIDQATADRIQARVFNNPSVSTEWSIRPSAGTFFDVARPNGQKAVTVEQLLRIGGQRSLAVKAAEQRLRMSEAEYAELASALRYQLHAALYRQFHVDRAVRALTSQLDVLKGIVDGYGTQLEKGNVSLREVTRLRSSYFTLNGERVGLMRQLNGIQENLHVLLADDRAIAFAPSASELSPMRALPSDITQLIARAEEQRPRVNAARAEQDAADLDLRLEKRRTVPDLALGATYDQNSNYLPDYWGLNAGLSIPLFDRNQGRIKRAHATADQARTQLELEQASVRAEVLRALADLRNLQEQYTSTTQGFATQLDQLSESLIANYVKSNITLLEFTDLFESYTASIIAINALEADLQNAYEELEFVSGQRLFDR